MHRNSHKSITFQKPDIGAGRPGMPSWALFLVSESGLTITEYAVAAGLIAATLTVTFGNLGMAIDAKILAVIAFI